MAGFHFAGFGDDLAEREARNAANLVPVVDDGPELGNLGIALAELLDRLAGISLAEPDQTAADEVGPLLKAA